MTIIFNEYREISEEGNKLWFRARIIELIDDLHSKLPDNHHLHLKAGIGEIYSQSHFFDLIQTYRNQINDSRELKDKDKRLLSLTLKGIEKRYLELFNLAFRTTLPLTDLSDFERSQLVDEIAPLDLTFRHLLVTTLLEQPGSPTSLDILIEGYRNFEVSKNAKPKGDPYAVVSRIISELNRRLEINRSPYKILKLQDSKGVNSVQIVRTLPQDAEQ